MAPNSQPWTARIDPNCGQLLGHLKLGNRQVLQPSNLSASKESFGWWIAWEGFDLVCCVVAGNGFASLEGTVSGEQNSHVVVCVVAPPDAHAC
jgi:hypothetical protein